MQIIGELTRVIFHNDENGYTVAVLDTEDGSLRAAGAMNEPLVGRKYSFEGSFVVHKKYGEQFSFSAYAEIRAEGAEAILEFLASGAIKGIGPVSAKLIVEAFGDEALIVIEQEPDRLLEIKGIGKLTLEKIVTSYGESKAFAEVSLELQSMGIEMADTVRIYKIFGNESPAIVRENPYILADEIRGFSFLKADRLADKLGFEEDSEFRIESAIKYVLSRWAVNGSTLMPEELLTEKVIDLIDTRTELVRECLSTMAFCGDIQTDMIDGVPVVYLYGYYYAEERTAHNLKRLMYDKFIAPCANVDNLIADAESAIGRERGEFELSDRQRNAVREALLNNVTVITGGPGTGKTTILNAIVKIFERLEIKTALAAPTGRAAKRMEEASGMNASTIHRLLEYVYSEELDEMSFGRNAENKLEQMAFIIDEASMIDIMLMDGLLEAIQSGARLILTGDVDQLPSVGAGNVLRDIISSEMVPTVRLTEIFRQAGDSSIVSNAHRINEGEYPEFSGAESDFFIIRDGNEQDILENIKSLVGGRLESHYDFIKSAADIQVLTPTKKGVLGAPNLNTIIQEVVNPPTKEKGELHFGSRIFREGDKVMQLRNNYSAEWKDINTYADGEGIFNGDMGIVSEICDGGKAMLVLSDEKLIKYEGEMLEEIDLAYAITVHKSQGCEFPAVIMPVWAFPPILMTRNLLYTAVTRGKKLVVIEGSEQRLQWMINNNRTDERYTGLKFRLESGFGGL